MAKSYLDHDGLTHLVSKIKSLINTKTVANAVTTAGTGAAYTATVNGITSLTAGVSFMMIPHTVSTSKTATLNVNSLGAKTIRRRVSNSTVTTVASVSASWLAANKPVRVTYDGTYWVADLDRPNAADIYGTLPIANGGTGATTAEAARANLGLDNIGSSGLTLLWENASPTSDFAAQTVSLDLSQYQFVVIEFNAYITDAGMEFVECLKVGITRHLYRVAATSNDKLWYSYRQLTTSESGIVFSDGAFQYATGGSTAAAVYNVPLRIYGMKVDE